MSTLSEKECIPCKGGMPTLQKEEIARLIKELPQWEVIEGHHIRRTFEFPDFVQGLAFVNQVGALAESQGHHPDIYLTWGKVRLEIFTHKVNGLTESDFVLAAKCEELLPSL